MSIARYITVAIASVLPMENRPRHELAATPLLAEYDRGAPTCRSRPPERVEKISALPTAPCHQLRSDQILTGLNLRLVPIRRGGINVSGPSEHERWPFACAREGSASPWACTAIGHVRRVRTTGIRGDHAGLPSDERRSSRLEPAKVTATASVRE